MKVSELSLFVLSARSVRDPSVEGALRYRKMNFFTMSSPYRFYLKEQQGIALVVTLLALVLITAMVVEFSYGVYTGTNNLYNWRDSQRLSIMAKSGINVTARGLKDFANIEAYKTRSEIDIPVQNPFEDFSGIIMVRIEDETSKFNINSIVFSQGNKRQDPAYESFGKLLEVLSLDKKIADRVVDWIQRKRESGSSLQGMDTKYYKLPSVDELLLIDGITRNDYDKLLPYITVYGLPDEFSVNANRSGKPVLMSIRGPNGGFPISEDLAERIIRCRELKPFSNLTEFNSCATISFSPDKVTTEGKFFTIKSTASSSGIKRIIEMVLDNSAGTIQYWKEY
jgi:general secretion pathway protein K